MNIYDNLLCGLKYMVTAYEIIINKYFAERLFSWRRIEDEKLKNDLTNNKVLYLIIS